jgi:hypothetical protein
MKARWTIVATLVAVVVATLALAGTASAQPSQTGGAFHLDDTYVDPYLSSVCGFEVIEHDVGVITFTSSNDQFSSHVSVRETFTNPETGTSVVVLVNATRTDSFVLIDENGSFSYTITFRGLNYKVFGADRTEISAGRVVDTFTFIFDENGNLVDVEFGESRTPHFEHFFNSKTEAAICETLAQ